MEKLRRNFIGLICVMFSLLFTLSIQTEAALDKPAQITGLKQIEETNTISFDIVWDKVEGTNIKYEVIVSTDVNATSIVKKSTRTTNSETINRLDPASVYYVKVRAYTSDRINGVLTTDYGEYSQTLKAVTAPEDSVENIKQTTVDLTSATLTWKAIAGSTGYKIDYTNKATKAVKTVNATTNSIKLTGLSKDSSYNVKITAYVQGDSLTAYSFRSEQFTISTKPTKVTGVKKIGYDVNKGTVTVTSNKIANAKGYEIYIYDGKTVVAKGNSGSNKQIKAISSKLKKSKYYKVKVRAYVVVNGKKVSGDWSNDIYVSPAFALSGKNTSKGIAIKWSKVSGATNYSVYISNKPKSGYKLFKTTSSNNITINKFNKKALKSGSKYYLYVVANKKVGKTTYKSDFYTYEVKYKK